MLAMIEYASDRTGDPADEDAAAKQVLLSPIMQTAFRFVSGDAACRMLLRQPCLAGRGAGRPLHPGGGDNAQQRHVARVHHLQPQPPQLVRRMHERRAVACHHSFNPNFTTVSRSCFLTRAPRYTSKVKKRDGHYGFAPANSR